MLTELERRYLQTDLEALAVGGVCERFRLFLLRINCEHFTDHKALLQIYSGTPKPFKRIERWVLGLQQFDLEIKCKERTENLANALLTLSIQSEIKKSHSVSTNMGTSL